ncbi:hypothetical protein LA080_003982 [Diaporthe eres]|nr:hypothetical protein LA080_003982 [Diaporthe eres]
MLIITLLPNTFHQSYQAPAKAKANFNMLLTSIVAGFLATAASAASIPRQAEPSSWSISDFYAGSSRFSIITTYRFDITDGNSSAYCVSQVSTQPEIGYAPLTECSDPTYSFFFGSGSNPDEPGYNLQIWQGNPEDTSCGAPSTNCVYTGIRFFPASDVETIVDPSGNPFANYDRLNAPAEFTVARTGVHI